METSEIMETPAIMEMHAVMEMSAVMEPSAVMETSAIMAKSASSTSSDSNSEVEPEPEMEAEPETNVDNVDFSNDFLARLFFKLHRLPWLQYVIVLMIRMRDSIDFHQYLRQPIWKDVDAMDTTNFRTLYKRIMWFNDSYTDPDFLCALELNTKLRFYNYDEVVWGISRVALNLSACILYFIMYYHLGHDHVTPTSILILSFSCAIGGYMILQSWRYWNDPWNLETFMKITLIGDVLVAVCCGVFSFLFAPVLRTVTTAVDIDTVHSICGILFIVHLFTHFYGMKNYVNSAALSMNSALFSMICLSSRLQSDNHCLALLSYGVLSFICFPQFSRICWEWVYGTIILVCIVLWAGYTISIWCMLFFVVVYSGMFLVSPAMFIFYMKYKLNIRGPWDEATLDLTIDMEEIDRGFERRRKQPPPPRIPIEQQREEEEIAKMEAMGIGLLL